MYAKVASGNYHNKRRYDDDDDDDVLCGVEVSVWKQKCESGEGGVRSEELDELKRKLMAKLQEAESQLETALGKAANLEKSNHRLKAELEDLTVETERVSDSSRVHITTTELDWSADRIQFGPVQLRRCKRAFTWLACILQFL